MVESVAFFKGLSSRETAEIQKRAGAPDRHRGVKMSVVLRRAFIQHTAAGAAAAAGTALAERAVLGASPYGWPIGCQTFPYGKARLVLHCSPKRKRLDTY